MNTKIDLYVVLGTGPLGQAVMRELARRGKSVRMVNRSGNMPTVIPPGVEIVGADLYSPEDVCKVTQGAAVVFHTAQPPYAQWPDRFPALQDSIIAGVALSGA